MRGIKKIDFNRLIFAGYFYVVWVIYIFVHCYKDGESKINFVFLLIVCFIVTVPIAFGVIHLIRKIQINREKRICNKKQQLRVGVLFFFLNFTVLLIWFLAYYPGAFSNDSINQYEQAVSGYYSDWHPFLHTLIFFTIPLKVTGRAFSIVLLQMVYLVIALAYMEISVYQYFGIRIALIVNAIIIFNPYICSIVMFPWKDVGFSIIALVIAVSVFNIYCSNSEWIKNKGHLVILAVALVVCTLFRHNAILYTLFVIISLWSFCGKKTGIKLTIITVALLLFVKGPTYNFFGVIQPDKRHSETMGVPMTIMANVAKEGSNNLSEETKTFIYQIATQEEYNEKYSTGNFNSIKWDVADTSIVDETNVLKILSMTAECIIKNPESSMKALFMLTDMVYSLDGEIKGEVTPYISDNNFGIEYKGNTEIATLLEDYSWIFNNSPLKYLRYIGTTVILMLAFILGRCSFSRKADLKKILLCIPILVYDFGTMLLLTGPDSRFFFVNFLVYPLVLILMLDKSRNKEE